MEKQDYKFIVLCTLALVAFIIFINHMITVCNTKEGIMVRSVWGNYKCIKVEKVDNTPMRNYTWENVS